MAGLDTTWQLHPALAAVGVDGTLLQGCAYGWAALQADHQVWLQSCLHWSYQIESPDPYPSRIQLLCDPHKNDAGFFGGFWA